LRMVRIRTGEKGDVVRLGSCLRDRPGQQSRAAILCVPGPPANGRSDVAAWQSMNPHRHEGAWGFDKRRSGGADRRRRRSPSREGRAAMAPWRFAPSGGRVDRAGRRARTCVSAETTNTLRRPARAAGAASASRCIGVVPPLTPADRSTDRYECHRPVRLPVFDRLGEQPPRARRRPAGVTLLVAATSPGADLRRPSRVATGSPPDAVRPRIAEVSSRAARQVVQIPSRACHTPGGRPEQQVRRHV